MTIKRRLVISNILMILVPVMITVLICLACVGMVWYTVVHETGHLEFSLQEEMGGFRLSLCDDGPGVPTESLPRLFDAFYRSDPARQNPNRGSGLGLSIAAGAIRRMDGKIHAEIGNNGGLAIVIWLPKAEE